MGTCRENRPSENTFRALAEMLWGMNNVIWYGKKFHTEDLREYVARGKAYLDKILEEFEKDSTN